MFYSLKQIEEWQVANSDFGQFCRIVLGIELMPQQKEYQKGMFATWKRGSGKTTLLEARAIYSAMFGQYSNFKPIVGDVGYGCPNAQLADIHCDNILNKMTRVPGHFYSIGSVNKSNRMIVLTNNTRIQVFDMSDLSSLKFRQFGFFYLDEFNSMPEPDMAKAMAIVATNDAGGRVMGLSS